MSSRSLKRRRCDDLGANPTNDSQQKTSPILVFAHGAGAPSTSEWMIRWKEMLGKVLHAVEVVTFDYPYMSGGKRRPPPKAEKLVEFHSDVVQKAVERHPGHPLILAGKSMGSRVSCLVANAGDLDVSAVVCLGYPLKGIGGAVRDEILQLTVPIMFVQGSRDALCPLGKLSAVRKKMRSANELHVVDGGDHSFKIGKRFLESNGLSQEDAEAEAVKAIAEFIANTMKRPFKRNLCVSDRGGRSSGEGRGSTSDDPTSSPVQPAQVVRQETIGAISSDDTLNYYSHRISPSDEQPGTSNFPTALVRNLRASDSGDSSSGEGRGSTSDDLTSSPVHPAQVVRQETIGATSSSEGTLSDFSHLIPPSDEQPDTSNSSKASVRVRGLTRMEHVWNMAEGSAKIPVTWNWFGQPYGEGQVKLSRFIGTLAKKQTLIPLEIESWEKLPKQAKDEAFKEILKRFDVPANGEKWVMHTLNRSRKDFKYYLKKKYFTEEAKGDATEAKKRRPAYIDSQPWDFLVDHWASEAGQELSKRNKSNREKLEIPHTCGGRSIPTIVAIETENNDGRPPSRAEIFIKTHKKKDGSAVNEKAAAIITQVEELNQRHTPEGSVSTVSSTARADPLAQVLGKDSRGRVRSMGLGVSSTSIWGRSGAHHCSHLMENIELKDFVKVCLQEIAEQKEKQKNMESKMVYILAKFEQNQGVSLSQPWPAGPSQLPLAGPSQPLSADCLQPPFANHSQHQQP